MSDDSVVQSSRQSEKSRSQIGVNPLSRASHLNISGNYQGAVTAVNDSMSPLGVSLSWSLMAVMMLTTQIEEASESALEAADSSESVVTGCITSESL